MKLAILAAALLVPGASAPQAQEAGPSSRRTLERFDRMNVFPGLPACESIPRQVAGPRWRNEGATRLDRLPPGQVLLAVERHFDGCREAVLLRDELLRTRR